MSRFGLSPDFTVLAYNRDLRFVNTEGFKAVEISHGVSLPQAFTFIIGLFNKPLEEVVGDLKKWLQDKGFSKDEIEEIVRAVPEQGIILGLPAVVKLTDEIQSDEADEILVSA